MPEFFDVSKLGTCGYCVRKAFLAFAYLVLASAASCMLLGTSSLVTACVLVIMALCGLLWLGHLVAFSARTTHRALGSGRLERRKAIAHLLKSLVAVGAISSLPAAWADGIKCPDGQHACGSAATGWWCCMNGYGCCLKKPHCTSAGVQCPSP